MTFFTALVSAALVVAVLGEGFEAMVLPRRVTRRLRLTWLYYRGSWRLWREVARALSPGKRRQAFLSIYGPLSLLGLFGVWVLGLILGFAGLHWSLSTPLAGGDSFGDYLYFSGGTFFTLGYGDMTPSGPVGHVLAV